MTEFGIHLRQDAYKLASQQKNVVRPFDSGMNAGNLVDSLYYGNSCEQRTFGSLLRQERRLQHHGKPDALSIGRNPAAG